MRKNIVKEKIRAGECAYGVFMKSTDACIAEIFGNSGLDFIVLDNEHVTMNRESMVNIIRACDCSGICPIVRVKENQKTEVLHTMDAGALGVQVPNVDTALQAKALVEAVKYPPFGSRGLSPSVRAASYGAYPLNSYIDDSNENSLIVAHCETVECINNLDEILALRDIDVIFIGPMDLSQSLGVVGQMNHESLKNAIATIEEKTKRAGKALGTIAATAQRAIELKEKGYQYVVYSADYSMIAGRCSEFIKALKAEER